MDLIGAGPDPITFVRTFNSLDTGRTPAALPYGWTHSYDRSIGFSPGTNANLAIALRPDGKGLYFSLSAGAWVPDADISDRLTETTDGSGIPTGWTYVVGLDDSVETYSGVGQLLTLTTRIGQTLTMGYSTTSTPTSIAPGPGYLIAVTNQFGRISQLTYGTQYLASVSDPAGQLYSYSYSPIVNDSASNVSAVVFPDTFSRNYLFDETANVSGGSFPWVLTGIIDESGGRYGTYQYNSFGQSVTTEHAGGADTFTASYTTDIKSNVLTAAIVDPLGTNRGYTFTAPVKINLVSVVTEPAGSGSSGASSAYTYDANGNVASKTDFDGNLTCSAWDQGRNLELYRVEGLVPSFSQMLCMRDH